MNTKNNINQNNNWNFNFTNNIVQMPNNPSPPGQLLNKTDIPSFKLISRGEGINEKEYYVIIHSAANALNAKEDPLPEGIIKRMKNVLEGNWMVFANVKGLKGYDFSCSHINPKCFLSFLIGNFSFHALKY